MYSQELIDKLNVCITACESCADKCLDEENIEMMVECIRLDKDCADVCRAAVNLLIRQSDMTDRILQICSEVCHDCSEECRKHEMQHCQDCARACHECEEACKSYVQ